MLICLGGVGWGEKAVKSVLFFWNVDTKVLLRATVENASSVEASRKVA